MNDVILRRLFAKQGYRVALIARNAEHLKNTADEINAAGGEVRTTPFRAYDLENKRNDHQHPQAAPFPVQSYTHDTLQSAFSSIQSHWPSSTSSLRAALFNAGHGVWKPFLDITPEEVTTTLETNVVAAFAFARAAILVFKENELDERGKRGTLIFTGATASVKGNTTTSAFSAGKHGVRALSQSLGKEFGRQNIHVAHVGSSFCAVSGVCAVADVVLFAIDIYIGYHGRR
jgi:NAD(P)-dependent dehydrogenase (short-subunit alcohol dehydrogenase family)